MSPIASASSPPGIAQVISMTLLIVSWIPAISYSESSTKPAARVIQWPAHGWPWTLRCRPNSHKNADTSSLGKSVEVGSLLVPA